MKLEPTVCMYFRIPRPSACRPPGVFADLGKAQVIDITACDDSTGVLLGRAWWEMLTSEDLSGLGAPNIY